MLTLEGERRNAVDRVPPHIWFVGSAIFHYLGPSFAVLLFARVPVGGVAWLRITSAAVVFALWRRPWGAFFATSAENQHLMVALGIVFAAMNYSFYHAIERLPLGTVAAIEFVGPIALAINGARTIRNAVALGAAVFGVYLLTDIRIAGDPGAFVWAFTNAALFVLYIVLAHRIANIEPNSRPIDRIGASMIVAAMVITPLGLLDARTALGHPVLLLAGVGVGITSSVFPYVCDQLAMARLARSTYALFIAILPATAVIIGMIVLSQIPRAEEVFAVALVIAGVAIHKDPS